MNDNLYSAFEEAFRGSRTEILTRLSGYNALLDDYVRHVDSPRALDLGCGRGEWLQVLTSHGYEARGVDSNQSFVNQCLALDLEVVCADVFDYLASLESQSIGLISCFHLIEHLSHAQLSVLFTEALRVLRADGLLLLETPSIDHLLVASKSFYSDPTHVTPIHPEALCFALRQAGFTWSTAIYLNGGPETDSQHERITRVFQGVAQDVCVLASPASPTFSVAPDACWLGHMHRAPTTLEALHQFNGALELKLQQLHLCNEELALKLERYQHIQLLNEDRLQLHDSRFERIARVYRGLRWWLAPLLLLRHLALRLSVAGRRPRQTLQRAIHATGLTSRRSRALLSGVLNRLGLYHLSLALYQRLFRVQASSRPFPHNPASGRPWLQRSKQIEADLARLSAGHPEQEP